MIINDYRTLPLMKYLKKVNSRYYHKILETREIIKNWLGYIPNTFPHYTRHTIEHSDEIILQLSKILFDGEKERPIIDLSPSEVYILISCAYYHDAGMVVSDERKISLVSSEVWKQWISEGGGKNRWREIESLRNNDSIEKEVRNFLADIQTRFLIAEFIRRDHHIRAAEMINLNQNLLANFSFGDQSLQKTICDICISHGLNKYELEDDDRFPERRNIGLDTVNVRFLAILLRIGDLLDLSYDRACPLLLNAACPLPSDSLVHWSQYNAIKHRLITPDIIEIEAECDDREEHRLLMDWCKWLVDEVEHARTLMSHSKRHMGWKPPKIRIGDPNNETATIKIKPSPKAIYKPTEWIFKIDNDIIFERLIFDLYEHEYDYIRELIQNALDANRSQMYLAMAEENVKDYQNPTHISYSIRKKYPIYIRLSSIQSINTLSGEIEQKQVLTIEDMGIGMDCNIIQNYLLQVGRSYYRTDEFRRKFRFAPISRFGIGFLSVFKVSDNITIETNKPSSVSNDGPIRAILTGPNNYVLTEKGSRKTNGTSISLILLKPMKKGELTEYVNDICKRVEFPIIVDEFGNQSEISAESSELFTYESIDVTDNKVKYAVRAFPLNHDGIDGELYAFARIDKNGESWDALEWYEKVYPTKHPQAKEPKFPEKIECFHGIVIRNSYILEDFGRSMVARIDYRGRDFLLNLSRGTSIEDTLNTDKIEEIIKLRWKELISWHLSNTHRAFAEDGWAYKQRLISLYKLENFWKSIPGTIRVFLNGETQLYSLNEFSILSEFTTIENIKDFRFIDLDYNNQLAIPELLLKEIKNIDSSLPFTEIVTPVVIESDLNLLDDWFRSKIFEKRTVSSVQIVKQKYMVIKWKKASGDNVISIKDGFNSKEVLLADLPKLKLVGIHLRNSYTRYGGILFNTSHPIIAWLNSINSICENELIGFSLEQYNRLISLIIATIINPHEHLNDLTLYISNFKESYKMPQDLQPPQMQLSVDMFGLHYERQISEEENEFTFIKLENDDISIIDNAVLIKHIDDVINHFAQEYKCFEKVHLIKLFTEAIVTEKSLDRIQKNVVIQELCFICLQSIYPKERRWDIVLHDLSNSIKLKVSRVKHLYSMWEKLQELII